MSYFKIATMVISKQVLAMFSTFSSPFPVSIFLLSFEENAVYFLSPVYIHGQCVRAIQPIANCQSTAADISFN